MCILALFILKPSSNVKIKPGIEAAIFEAGPEKKKTMSFLLYFKHKKIAISQKITPKPDENKFLDEEEYNPEYHSIFHVVKILDTCEPHWTKKTPEEGQNIIWKNCWAVPFSLKKTTETISMKNQNQPISNSLVSLGLNAVSGRSAEFLQKMNLSMSIFNTAITLFDKDSHVGQKRKDELQNFMKQFVPNIDGMPLLNFCTLNLILF